MLDPCTCPTGRAVRGCDRPRRPRCTRASSAIPPKAIEPLQYYRSRAKGRERLQLDHAHPEHGLAADVDVVLAYEGELAVVADAEDGQTGWDVPDRVAVSHVHRKIVLGHEHASTRIEVKRARMDGARLDVLDRGRLAGGLVDGE